MTQQYFLSWVTLTSKA